MNIKTKRLLLKELKICYSMCPWYDDSRQLNEYLENRIKEIKKIKVEEYE